MSRSQICGEEPASAAQTRRGDLEMLATIGVVRWFLDDQTREACGVGARLEDVSYLSRELAEVAERTYPRSPARRLAISSGVTGEQMRPARLAAGCPLRAGSP